jgi:hypothetical protein
MKPTTGLPSPRPLSDSERSRYFTRARDLVSDKVFLSRVAKERRRWNLDYPSYPASGAGEVPSREALPTLLDIPLPPQLLRAFKAASISDLRSQFEFYGVGSDWTKRLETLCEEFWPSIDFPHGLQYRHPSMAFVAACLLYDIQRTGPEEWRSLIWSDAPSLHLIGESTDALMARRVAFLLAEEIGRLWAQLEGIVGERRPLSPDDLQSAVNESRAIVEQGLALARLQVVLTEAPGKWVVPIIEGMRSTDLRQVDEQIRELLAEAEGDDPVGNRIRALAAEGLSRRAIARRLGLSLPAVSNVLNPSRE